MQVSPPGVTARRCLSGRIAAEPTPSSVLHAAAHACWAEPEAPACHVERSRNISRESRGRTSARPPSFLRRQEPRLGVAPLSLQGERVRARVTAGRCGVVRFSAQPRSPVPAVIQRRLESRRAPQPHAVRGMVAGAGAAGVRGRCRGVRHARRSCGGRNLVALMPPSFQRRLESSRALPCSHAVDAAREQARCARRQGPVSRDVTCPVIPARQEPRSPYPPSFQRRLESSRALPRTRCGDGGRRQHEGRFIQQESNLPT